MFSFVEWLSWRRFTLTPAETSQMRDDLRKLELGHRRMSDEGKEKLLARRLSEEGVNIP